MKKKNKKEKRQYATSKDGVNYRAIADQMTVKGHAMNHSSARNYVLRAMKKFAQAFNRHYQLNLSDEQINTVTNSSKFQSAVSVILKDLIDDPHSNQK
mgnify:CR=1 FL=1